MNKEKWMRTVQDDIFLEHMPKGMADALESANISCEKAEEIARDTAGSDDLLCWCFDSISAIPFQEKDKNPLDILRDSDSYNCCSCNDKVDLQIGILLSHTYYSLNNKYNEWCIWSDKQEYILELAGYVYDQCPFLANINLEDYG